MPEEETKPPIIDGDGFDDVSAPKRWTQERADRAAPHRDYMVVVASEYRRKP